MSAGGQTELENEAYEVSLTHVSGTCNAIAIALHQSVSQRSLHNAPIFRLLLKVAVNGTHQCDFLNFCGGLGPQHLTQHCPSYDSFNFFCKSPPGTGDFQMMKTPPCQATKAFDSTNTHASAILHMVGRSSQAYFL